MTYSADNAITCQDKAGQFNQKHPTTAGDITNCYKSRNTVKNSVECTQSTLDTINTNWWARRDLNPENNNCKTCKDNDLQKHPNSPLPTVCPKSQAQFSEEIPQKNVLLNHVLNQHDLSLAQAIIAIDQLPIDSSTKVSLIKELATKLTEPSTPESPEDSPNE